MIENLVFSGAGIKLYTFVGFVKYLNEKDILKNITVFNGTSSGSLIAVLLALKLKYKEIEEILLKLDLSNFKNINTEKIMNFFDNYGVDDAGEIKRILKIIFNAKINNDNPTFKELYDITEKKLVISATCINTMTIEYFDYEVTPDLYVSDAIIMSICIPFLYKPVKYNNKYYIDGALTKHYPIDYFKNEKNKTLGILVSSKLDEYENIENIKDYITNVLSCCFFNLVKNCYNEYKDNTVLIENNHNFLDFDIEYNSKLNLLNQGYEKTKETLETENFKKYYKL